METIIVGVDGSKNAESALRWAVEEADRHGASVVAVLAWDYLNQHSANGDESFDPSYGSEEAGVALHAAVQAVTHARPIEERVVLDRPSQALVDAAGAADLLVVGARGLGGFKGLLLGSVSEGVLENATCPVAVLREDGAGRADGAVVVGIDASDTARKALRWAAGEARARRAPLHVVHAWRLPDPATSVSKQLVSSVEDAARGVLEAALQDPSLAGLAVEGHMPPSGAAQALLGFADDASLIVVGSRGLGRFGRAVLGSTSRQLAHHAPCPVVIVPADG